jgi:polar amino acid transport system substrate-binding protein
MVFVAVAWIGAFTAGCASKGVVAVPDVKTADASSGLAADPAASPDPKRSYRIGVEGNFPQFAVYDASKRQLSGYDIELMKAVVAKAGLDVEYVNVGSNLLLTGVLNCDYDAGISAIAITDQLRQQMMFSEPYLTVGQVIVVKKGNIVITDRDSLAGMTVGVLNGSPSASGIQSIPNVEALQYPMLDQAFKDLIKGNIDAVVASRPSAVSYTSIPANKLKIVSDEFGVEDYGIAICSQDAELAQKINDGLAAIKADGTLDKLTRNWLKNSAIR